MVMLYREPSYVNMLRSYKVLVDDKYLYDIKNKQVKKINLNSGKHTIQIKMDWYSSKKLNISVDENSNIELKCPYTQKRQRMEQLFLLELGWDSLSHMKKLVK